MAQPKKSSKTTKTTDQKATESSKKINSTKVKASKGKSKIGSIISKLKYLFFLLLASHYIYIYNVCPLNSELTKTDDQICEITHNSYNNYILPTYNDYLIPTYDNYIKPSYYSYVKPSYNNYIKPSYNNYIAPSFNTYIYPLYEKHVVPNYVKYLKPHVDVLTENKYLNKAQETCSPLVEKAQEFWCVFSEKCHESVPYLVKFKECSYQCILDSIAFIKENYHCLGNSSFYLKFSKTYIFQFTLDLANKIIVKFNEFVEGFQKDKLTSKMNQVLEGRMDFLRNEVYNKYFNGEFTSSSSTTTTTTSASTSKEMSGSGKSSPLPTNEKYRLILDKVSQSAISDFNSQIEQVESKYLSKIENNLLVEIRKFSTYTQSGYDEIHNLIYSINDDSKDFVSRQDFRDKLKELTEKLNDKSDEFAKELKSLPVDYSNEILKLRKSVLETLEEFSESTLSEYSKELTYKSEISTDSDSESWNDWKQFKILKDDILKTRDEILQIDSTPSKLLAKIKELDQTLNIIINDIGSYLAILRAKANLAFQEREKLEKLKKEEDERRLAAQEADKEIVEEGELADYENCECEECSCGDECTCGDAEPERITSSITRYLTITVDTDATTTAEPVAEIETPEPESTPELEEDLDDGVEEESVSEPETIAEPEIPHHEEIDVDEQIIDAPFDPIKVIVGEQEQMILDSIHEEA